MEMQTYMREDMILTNTCILHYIIMNFTAQYVGVKSALRGFIKRRRNNNNK